MDFNWAVFVEDNQINQKLFARFLSVFFGETRTICNLTLLLKLHNQNRKRELGHVCGHYVIIMQFRYNDKYRNTKE